MNTITRAATAIAGALTLSTPAMATDVSYDFLEVRFVDSEIANIDGDGFALGGSYNFHENWLVTGSYTSQDFDFDVDLTAFELGVGYVWALDPQYDLFATGSYVDVEVDGTVGSASDDGFRFVGGIRSRLNERIEVRAALNYLDIDDSDTFVELAGDYYFTDQFAFGITVDVGGDTDEITLGGRYFFGNRRVR